MTQPRRPFGNRPQLGQTGPTPSERVTAALDTINGAAARLRSLRVDHQAAVQEIRRQISNDPNLTAEGRTAAIRDRCATAGATALANVQALRDELERAESAVDDVVQANWPAPVPGVEGLFGRQALWVRHRQLLDTNVLRLTGLIAEADDTEVLYAIRDEAPIWARSQGATAATVEQIEQAVDLRLAAVAGGTTEVDLFAAFQARATVAVLEPLLDQAEAEANSATPFGMGLTAAVAASMAQRAVSAASMPIVNPDGTVL